MAKTEKKIVLNGEEVKPIKKHKLWELKGWTPGKIQRMLLQKQKEHGGRK